MSTAFYRCSVFLMVGAWIALAIGVMVFGLTAYPTGIPVGG